MIRPTAEESLVQVARRERVRQAVANLPTDQRDALIRRFYREDLTELPPSPGSKSWQHKLCAKAISALRIELAELGLKC